MNWRVRLGCVMPSRGHCGLARNRIADTISIILKVRELLCRICQKTAGCRESSVVSPFCKPKRGRAGTAGAQQGCS